MKKPLIALAFLFSFSAQSQTWDFLTRNGVIKNGYSYDSVGVATSIGLKVPYTGATSPVNLGSQTITAGSYIIPSGTSSQLLRANGTTGSTLPFSAITSFPRGLDFFLKSIIFFGDSYIQGTGASTTAKRWPSILCNSVGATEVNNGVGGTTIEKRSPINYMASPNMVDNVSAIPRKTSSRTLLVFAFGLNDMGYTGANYTPANFITDYTTVLNAAIDSGWNSKNILLIPPYYIPVQGYTKYGVITGIAAPDRTRHLQFVEATRQVSENYGALYFDIFDAQFRNDTTLINNLVTDPIHPNDAGHRFIASAICKYLGSYLEHGSLIGNLLIVGGTALVGSELLSVQGNTNGPVQMFLKNSSSGSSAYNILTIANDISQSSILNTSSGFTPSGQYVADQLVVNANGTGGLSLGAVHASGELVLRSGGITGRWKLNTTGHLLAFTDNTYDIGASGAARPRIGYFGTSVNSVAFNATGAYTQSGSSANTFTGSTTLSSSVQHAYVAKTSTYTATASDYTVDCTTGTFTVTLPTAVGITGRYYVIKNSGAGLITIATTSSQTIDGVATQSRATGLPAMVMQSNGANWLIVSM